MPFQKAEIHFYDQDKCAVFLESDTSGEDEIVAEFQLFALYCIRMLSNFGVNETSDSLAEALSNPPMIQAVAETDNAGGVSLVPYQGHAGRYSFLATMSGSGAQTQFIFKSVGFGWLGKGLGYYGPTSVMAFVRKLAQKRNGDEKYVIKLVFVAYMCGRFHLDRNIALKNHGELAALAVQLAMKEATDSP